MEKCIRPNLVFVRFVGLWEWALTAETHILIILLLLTENTLLYVNESSSCNYCFSWIPRQSSPVFVFAFLCLLRSNFDLNVSMSSFNITYYFNILLLSIRRQLIYWEWNTTIHLRQNHLALLGHCLTLSVYPKIDTPAKVVPNFLHSLAEIFSCSKNWTINKR